MYVCMHVFAYFMDVKDIQLPCGPASATVPGMVPETSKTKNQTSKIE
jgi:hypothetical protein